MFRKRRTAKHQARFDQKQLESIEIGKWVSWAQLACSCCDAAERPIEDVLRALGLELSKDGIVRHATPGKEIT